jgi:AcrR family transcriptional regulator
MATAAKALGLLRQQGLVETREGIGTVVRRTPSGPLRSPSPPLSGSLVTRDQIVGAAVAIADVEGIAALSMRRLAGELGVGVTSLHRFVSGKRDLLRAMVQRTMGSKPLPDLRYVPWRSALELISRTQWELYRAHPWLPGLISLRRPRLIPEAMANTEGTLQVLTRLGLDPEEAVLDAITLPALVRALALVMAADREIESETGVTESQWRRATDVELQQLSRAGRFPHLAATAAATKTPTLDSLFEHGLRRHLDGLEARLARRPGGDSNDDRVDDLGQSQERAASP